MLDVAIPARAELRVLIFGTYEAARHPRIAVLIEGFRSAGLTVRECNAPLGLDTAERVRMLRHPNRLPLLFARMMSRWGSLVVRSISLRRKYRPEVVVVGYMGHFDVLLARALWPRTTIVLDHLIFAGETADDRRVGGFRTTALAALDRIATSVASIVVVDTPEHEGLLRGRGARRSIVIPVGAQSSWFDAGAMREPVGVEKKISVIFFGLMTPLQGAPVIAQALKALGGRVNATVVGEGQDGPEVDHVLEGVPDVTRLSWIAATELPHLVAAHDVCLGIFGQGTKALSVVPNKVFEGAAAGCALITSNTKPQADCLSKDAVLTPPGDALALELAILSLVHDRDLLADFGRRATALARERFTAEAVVEPLLAFLRDER